MREVLDKIVASLKRGKQIIPMEDGSNETSAYLAVVIDGKGYAISIVRAEQFDDKE